MAVGRLLGAAVVGAGVGAAVTVEWQRQRQAQPRPADPASSMVAASWYPRPTLVVKEHDGFVLGFDRRLRESSWVYSRLTRDSIRGDASRSGERFRQDVTVRPCFRQRPNDYKHSGYDRGHLVPAADLKSSQAWTDESFLLSNVCPQHPRLNRTFWRKLESWTRSLTGVFDEVHVVSGPLFLPQLVGGGSPDSDSHWETRFRMIGHPVSVQEAEERPYQRKHKHEHKREHEHEHGDKPRKPKPHKHKPSAVERELAGAPLVPVPTHFFKVVVGRHKSDERAFLAAFVVPNAPVKESRTLSDFTVPIGLVEVLSGHLMFPNLLHAHQSSPSPSAQPEGPQSPPVPSNVLDLFAELKNHKHRDGATKRRSPQ